MGGRFESDSQSVVVLFQILVHAISNENIKQLKLNCFEKFLETNQVHLLEDGISYLFDSLQNRYNKEFFNSLVNFYQEKKGKILIKTPNSITKKEINEIHGSQ